MSKKVVIKIGSSNLVKDGNVNIEKIEKLGDIIKEYREKGYEFIIVSSGAVALGRERVGLKNHILSINQKQAMAAIGQPLLMKSYDSSFYNRGLLTAQILLTKDDLHNRKRYINSRNTIWELLSNGVVPVINENDTVSTSEIKIGDNDNLSALVAAASESDMLIILSDIEGLYDKNPKEHEDALLIREVHEITEEIERNCGGSGSKVGTGGMITKIEAAKLCMKFGVEMYIVNGNNLDNISMILDEKGAGTKFFPEKASGNRKKMWIAYGLKAKGELYVDSGAEKALKTGKSLLAKGIIKSAGKYRRGDMVLVYNEDGVEIARGLSGYSSEDMEKVTRKNSNEIEEIFGKENSREAIHRDEMYLNEGAES